MRARARGLPCLALGALCPVLLRTAAALPTRAAWRPSEPETGDRNDGFQALAPAQEGGRESLMLSGEGCSKDPRLPGRGGGGAASSQAMDTSGADVTCFCSAGTRLWQCASSAVGKE